jgi:hypothetical protein
VVTEPQPLCAGRVSPHRPCSQGSFAPVMCYYHHPRSYDPMRQSRAHQRTSRLAVISPASRARDLPRFDHTPFGCCRHPYAGGPVARMRPTPSATALAIIPIERIWHPHPHCGAEHSLRSSWWVHISTLQCSRHVAAPSVASLLGHRPRCLHRAGLRDLYVRATPCESPPSGRRTTLPGQAGQLPGPDCHRLGVSCCGLHSKGVII